MNQLYRKIFIGAIGILIVGGELYLQQELQDNQSALRNVEQQLSDLSPTSQSRAKIITQWTPSVAKVICSFSLTNSQTVSDLRKFGVNTDPVVLEGSGFLKEITDPFRPGAELIAIITNRHVVTAYNGFDIPKSCQILLPGGHNYSVNSDDVYFLNGDDPSTGKERQDPGYKIIQGQPYWIAANDAAYLVIKYPDTYLQNIAQKPSVCTIAPKIGDDVTILGYPTVGSDSGITATEGIISGIEDGYYVTSAKIEHGNSGGVAILTDNDCYLGIPSYAVTGEIESLARILDFKHIFK